MNNPLFKICNFEIDQWANSPHDYASESNFEIFMHNTLKSAQEKMNEAGDVIYISNEYGPNTGAWWNELIRMNKIMIK